MALELDGVVKEYPGGVAALRGVSLEVPDGDQVAVVGPSGSGKTTMLTIMGTLERSTAGTVRVAGHDIGSASDRELAGLRAHEIGFVFQGFHLQEAMSVVDNVALGMLYTGESLRHRRGVARQALERVGLSHRLEFKPKQLSGGERQRVAIARAIAKRPAIMLADEPTGNLDSKSGGEVIDLLHRLASDGATLVLITHDERIASGFGRRVQMRDGEIVGDDPGMNGVAAAQAPGGSSAAGIGAAHLPARELIGTALGGLRTRRLRAALSALGIAIGIGAMVAVVGVSASAQANLLAEIDALGTNLLTVSPGQTFLGANEVLPDTAVPMIGHMLNVESDAAVYQVSGVGVYRTPLVPTAETGGIGVDAAGESLPLVIGTSMEAGHFLDGLSGRFPEAVLGAQAAQILQINQVGGHVLIYLGNTWFQVIGILKPALLDSSLDSTVFISLPIAARMFDVKPNPSTIYVRANQNDVVSVSNLLAPTADPQNADGVEVSRPSDALEARAAAKGQFTTLLLGLGAVALLVGAIGIANIMVISVLERRGEIGLRRALGATRRHITAQFLAESALLAALGGVAGLALGAGATEIYALTRSEPFVVPVYALVAAPVAGFAIGAIAGLYPAAKAARLSPTEALRAT